MKARYDDLVKGAGGNREYHLHHILVSDERQRKDLIAKIKAGAKFGISRSNTRRIRVRARTAAISTGPTRRRTCRNSQRPREAAEGQMTDTPVKTQFGWHIIRVDDIRDIARRRSSR